MLLVLALRFSRYALQSLPAPAPPERRRDAGSARYGRTAYRCNGLAFTRRIFGTFSLVAKKDPGRAAHQQAAGANTVPRCRVSGALLVLQLTPLQPDGPHRKHSHPTPKPRQHRFCHDRTLLGTRGSDLRDYADACLCRCSVSVSVPTRASPPGVRNRETDTGSRDTDETPRMASCAAAGPWRFQGCVKLLEVPAMRSPRIAPLPQTAPCGWPLGWKAPKRKQRTE